MEAGKTFELKIKRMTPQGAYLSDGESDVLLPSKQVPEGAATGDAITVFVYRDSKDRIISTTRKPLIQLGEIARLKVREMTGIGAFLDIGLERDLLLPFHEMTKTPEEGDEVLVAMYLDKSPEYWAGWALAFYQWYTSRSFIELLSAVPFSELIKMYPVYHEMDIEQFIDHMDKLIQNAYPSTRLRAKRINNRMSQSELARDSGVALRQIQLFEQRQRDINNASAITLLKLSRSLHCRMEDLIEL